MNIAAARDLLSRASVDVFVIRRERPFEKQAIADGRDVDSNVRPAIAVNRVGRDVEGWNGVAEHGGVSCKYIPVNLGNPVTGFAASDGGKLKRPMNVGVLMANIEPFPERHKFVALRISI
jgi:hypothetical protein